PDCVLMFFDRVLAFDHVRHEIHIIAAANVSKTPLRRAYDRALKSIKQMETLLRSGMPRPALSRATASGNPTAHPLKLKRTTDYKTFLEDVTRVKEYISAGDVFQTVLSQRLEMEPGVPPVNIYRALRRV